MRALMGRRGGEEWCRRRRSAVLSAAPPPTPSEDLPARNSSPDQTIPSPPPAIPASKSKRKIPDMLGSDPGSEGWHMQQWEGLEDGQDDVDGDDSPLGTYGAGRKRKQCNKLPPARQRKWFRSPVTKPEGLGGDQDDVNGACSKWKHGSNLMEAEQQQRKALVTKNAKSASPPVRSPLQVATSPGVNILMRATILKRAVLMANSARRARIAGSAPIPPTQPPQFAPTLQNLSPNLRTTNSHVSNRKLRKLISSIWREAMPIYDGRRLVEGRCNYCHQVFPASRNFGTSHILRHLKVCTEKTAMNEMVDKMGCPEGIVPNWKFDAITAIRKLVKLVVVMNCHLR